MRIGIDCRMYSSLFTGIGRYTFELVKHIIKLNQKIPNPHEIILFFNNPEFRSYTPPNKNIKKVLADAPHYSFREQTHFLKILKNEKLDHMHFTHFNKPYFYHRPYTVTIHDLTLTFYPGRKMTRFHQRLAYHCIIKNAVKKARKVIAVSNNTKNDIIKTFRIPPKKIKVIYNGVSDFFTQLTNQAPIQKTLNKFKITKPFLLYTGVWRSHKNLPRLIQAYFELINIRGLDLQLVITGKPDPLYPEIKQSIKNLKLASRVILTNLVTEKELLHLYNAAAIYVFPSLYEGFGIPPLEAMKCGTPVAVSDTSSLPEICGLENAVYFNPLSTQDIAEKIEILYKDTEKQTELITNGFAHARRFTWEKMAKETFKIITHV